MLEKATEKPITMGTVSLIASDSINGTSSLHLSGTDSVGGFVFDNLEIWKDSWGVVKVKNAKGKSIHSIVKLDSMRIPEVSVSVKQYQTFTSPNQDFLEQAVNRKQIDIAFDTTKLNYLDTVVVTAARSNPMEVRKLHLVADAVIINDQPTYGTFFDLIRGKVPGLDVVSSNGITTVRIRNLGVPLVLLNGVPLNPFPDESDLYYDFAVYRSQRCRKYRSIKDCGYSKCLWCPRGRWSYCDIYKRGECPIG